MLAFWYKTMPDILISHKMSFGFSNFISHANYLTWLSFRFSSKYKGFVRRSARGFPLGSTLNTPVFHILGFIQMVTFPCVWSSMWWGISSIAPCCWDCMYTTWLRVVCHTMAISQLSLVLQNFQSSSSFHVCCHQILSQYLTSTRQHSVGIYYLQFSLDVSRCKLQGRE